MTSRPIDGRQPSDAEALASTIGLRNRGSEVRTLPDAPAAEPDLENLTPSPAPRDPENQDHAARTGQHVLGLAGYELEQKLRAVVLGGLFPLLDVLVRGEIGALCSQPELDALLSRPSDPLALQQLELACRSPLFESWWLATDLGLEVHQQLAVLRYQGLRDFEPHRGAWRDVLLFGWQRCDRGKRLLEWLRLGSPEAHCFVCDAQATGLSSPGAEGDAAYRAARARQAGAGGWELACDRHRTEPLDWSTHALDLGLDPNPSLPGASPADAEVGHGA